MSFKSGFVSIIGRPNAGKSTLLNRIMDEKLAIVCDKPQTTRNNINGILNGEDYQIIFTDTPGIHKPKHALGRSMNKGVYSALQDVDVIYYIVDATKPFGSGDEFVIDKFKNSESAVFLLLNKVDLLSKGKVLDLLQKWTTNYDFAEVFPLSAAEGYNVSALVTATLPYLKGDFKYYPDDMTSDRSDTFRIKEIIREKILYKTIEEVPHSVAVVVESIDEHPNSIEIAATIVVEKDSQKGIIIGKQAKMLTSIKMSSQKELKQLLNKRVDLELYVRVEKNWRDQEQKLKALGYKDFDNE